MSRRPVWCLFIYVLRTGFFAEHNTIRVTGSLSFPPGPVGESGNRRLDLLDELMDWDVACNICSIELDIHNNIKVHSHAISYGFCFP